MKKLLFTVSILLAYAFVYGQVKTQYYQFSQKTYLDTELGLIENLYKISHDKKTAILSNVTKNVVSEVFTFDRITNTHENIYYIFKNSFGDMLVVDVNGKLSILFEEKTGLADWNKKTLFFNIE
jgi:hypothetical protein